METTPTTNPTIRLIMRSAQAHVLAELAAAEKDQKKKAELAARAKECRGDIGPVAYRDALAFIARNGPVAQQAHGWVRVALAQLGLNGSWKFGDVIIEVK
jgi:hypothetical protein